MEEMICKLCNKKITVNNYSGIAYICSNCVSEINSLDIDNYELPYKDIDEDVSEKEDLVEYIECDLKKSAVNEIQENDQIINIDKVKSSIKDVY